MIYKFSIKVSRTEKSTDINTKAHYQINVFFKFQKLISRQSTLAIRTLCICFPEMQQDLRFQNSRPHFNFRFLNFLAPKLLKQSPKQYVWVAGAQSVIKKGLGPLWRLVAIKKVLDIRVVSTWCFWVPYSQYLRKIFRAFKSRGIYALQTPSPPPVKTLSRILLPPVSSNYRWAYSPGSGKREGVPAKGPGHGRGYPSTPGARIPSSVARNHPGWG